jgi:hypothetical protein
MYVYVTMSVSTGLYPNLDLWTANKLQLQLQCMQYQISREFNHGKSVDICV